MARDRASIESELSQAQQQLDVAKTSSDKKKETAAEKLIAALTAELNALPPVRQEEELTWSNGEVQPERVATINKVFPIKGTPKFRVVFTYEQEDLSTHKVEEITSTARCNATQVALCSEYVGADLAIAWSPATAQTKDENGKDVTITIRNLVSVRKLNAEESAKRALRVKVKALESAMTGLPEDMRTAMLQAQVLVGLLT